jgi:trk system potassium uptake protein TrkH
MKNRNVYKYLGKVLIGFSLAFVFPMIVAIIHHERIFPFLIPSLISLIVGFLLNQFINKTNDLYAKEGFIIVALSWIVISVLSSVPYMLGEGMSFYNAFFESVSGLTTTGTSVIKDVESLQKGILFWRSFTHFLGGMGVLTFVMAIIPLSKKDKSMHLLKAEMPGPNVAKLVPSLRKTLFFLYGIYIFLTVSEVILLLIGKMPFFDSLLISFGTAGTGGFAVLNSSIASYSNFAKWVIAIFMFLFGVNFNIYFLLIIRDFKSVFKSEELRTYFIIFIGSVIFVVINSYHQFATINEAILNGFFHISSFMTSTGYSIGNVNVYGTPIRVLVLLLMLISACAGSTCGGFKMSRLIICAKKIKRDLVKLVHPNMVKSIFFEGKKVEEDTIESTTSFLLLYSLFIIFIMFIVSFDPLKLTISQTINAVFTTFANVGLCFELTSFAEFSGLSKIVLSIGMLLGRLELYPIIVLFTNINK